MISEPARRCRYAAALLCAALLLASACNSGRTRQEAIPSTHAPVLLFFGDSITSGAALGAELAYPALLERRLSEAGLDLRVVNAGVSGDTTSDALARLAEAVRLEPALVVVELGANDAFRGVPAQRIQRNLEEIVRGFQRTGATVVIAAVKLGGRFEYELGPLSRAAADSTGAVLVEDMLAGVAGVPSMNLPDGIHPNAEGHREIARRLWPVLAATLSVR